MKTTIFFLQLFKLLPTMKKQYFTPRKQKILIALFCLLLTFNLFAQRTYTGIVYDENRGLLEGATIMAKGTQTGTVTKADGSFSLQVPPNVTVLQVSYLGFQTSELTLGENPRLEVTMREGVVLSEAIVTALGVTRSEKSLGYAVAQVDGSQLNKVRDANIVNSLAGRAAGVQVVGSNGNMGSSSRITIRGIKSINGNNQPLFVVDGVPMDNSNFTGTGQAVGGYVPVPESEYDFGNSIQDLNPDDIDNISVLKGQAAAALYGSRGVNGVIMVTTKKGSKNKKGLGVTINSGVTFDKISVVPTFQDKYGGGDDLLPQGYSDNSGYYKTPFIQLGEAGDTIGNFASFDLVPIYGIDESNGVRFATTTDEHFAHLEGQGYQFYNGKGTNQSNLHFRDWNSWDRWDTPNFGQSRVWEVGDNPFDFYETGVSSNQNIAFEGGGDHTSFRLSYNRFDQKGILPNANMNRNTLSFNGNLDLSDNLKAFVGVNYVKTTTKGRSVAVYSNRGGQNPAQNFNQWWHRELRFADLQDYENPDGTMRTWNRQSADNPRPLFWDNPYWTREKNYENDGRNRIFGNFGLTYKINSWLSATGRMLTDFYTEGREERIVDGSLNLPMYSQDIYRVSETNTDLMLKASHNLTNSLVLDAFVGGNKLWSTKERDFASTVGGFNVPGIYRVQNSKERPFIENRRTKKEIESLFAGATLGWKSMLYLDLSGRKDWSSTLPDGANGYFYPSASMSYVFSEMVKIPKLSFGKLRIGWASVGSDTDPYNIYTTYKGNVSFGSNPSYTVPNTLNNSTLRPEKTTSIEAGVDLRFFLDRLGIDVTVYNGSTTDQIIPLSTTGATGYTQQFINAGEISNKGIELTLNLVPVRTQHFSWDIAFNYGKNQNKIVSLIKDDPSITSLPLANGIGAVSVNAYIGQPYGTVLGTNYLYDISGSKLINPADGSYLVSSGVMPIGNTTPDFTGGVTNTFRWKSISLSAFVDFRKGGDIYSSTNLYGLYSGTFDVSAIGDARENGTLNEGILAEMDVDGNPIQDFGADTESLLDDTYKSSGTANTTKLPYEVHKIVDGGLVNAAASLYDGSFIKLREMSLGWTLPKKWLKNAKIQDVTVSAVGRNLAILFKNLPNLDPDSAFSTSNVQGLEFGGTPTTRSLGVNVSCKF
jgi:TonB-linked SusC/RagA family outer membrane protein